MYSAACRAVTGRPTYAPRVRSSCGRDATPNAFGWWSFPPDEARPLLRLFPVEVPTGVGFMKNAGLVTGPNPDEYEALAGRCPVFRFEPVNA